MIAEIQAIKDKNTRFSNFAGFKKAINDAMNQYWGSTGHDFVLKYSSGSLREQDFGSNLKKVGYVDIDNPYTSPIDPTEIGQFPMRQSFIRVTYRRGNRISGYKNEGGPVDNVGDTTGYYVGNLITGGYGLKSEPIGTTTVPKGEWFEATGKDIFVYEIGPSTAKEIMIQLLLGNANHRYQCIQIFIAKRAPDPNAVWEWVRSSVNSIGLSSYNLQAGAQPAMPSRSAGPVRSSHFINSSKGIVYPFTSLCRGNCSSACQCSCHDEGIMGANISPRPNNLAYISCFNGGNPTQTYGDGPFSAFGETFQYEEDNVPEGTVYGIVAVAEVAHIPDLVRVKLVDTRGIGVGRIWTIDSDFPIVNEIDNTSEYTNPQ